MRLTRAQRASQDARRIGLTRIVLILGGIALALLLLRPIARAEPSSNHTVFLPVVNLGTTSASTHAIVFVSRQIPPNGSVYWDVPNDMPGVGPYSRFRVAAPGKLQIREPNGTIRTLIDGSNPTAASKGLIDVNAPDVSYDGRTIVFAGLPAGEYSPHPNKNPGAWRLYTIGVDGSGLRQITRSDQNLNLAQFNNLNALRPYDDTDPVWLPDGRIVFASTRWPAIAHYSASRTTNLYVVNADGSDLHRITSERNGAERPLIDPRTGKIVYSRWWRNHRFAAEDMGTIPVDANDPSQGYYQKDGLTVARRHVGGSDNLWRNHWAPTEINPDGTELRLWRGVERDEDSTHMYGGAFAQDGALIANFFPMINMTEAAGFGGLRRYERGATNYQPLIGITYRGNNLVNPSNPTSYGIEHGPYAGEPDVYDDGTIVFSYAADIQQDYGLYLLAPDGSPPTLLYDNPGTTELRARVIRRRSRPPIIPDTVSARAPLLPPPASGPYDSSGTFVFDALNVYANAPVDWPMVSAPPVGSAHKIRFFVDHQRTSPGSLPALDWPILLGEKLISPAGAVREPNAPADVPLFEQIRSADGSVPLTIGPRVRMGAAHVAGLNFGRPGTEATCVGCHTGHTLIPVPDDPEEAKFSNLSPGASVRVSTVGLPGSEGGLIDRRVMTGRISEYWTSRPGQHTGQWVELTFPVPVSVRTVRLYNPRFGDTVNSTIQVNRTTVRLFADAAGTQEVALNRSGPLSVAGTDVPFPDVRARVVRIEIDNVSGTWGYNRLASLAEVEVIARGEAGP